MSDNELTAYVGAWSRPDADEPGGHLILRYAVLAKTPEEAEKLILASIDLPSVTIEMQSEPLAPADVERKGMKPEEVVDLGSNSWDGSGVPTGG